MTRLIVSLTTLCTILLGAITYRTLQPEEWSYIVLSPADDKLSVELDKAGALGYELVFARRASDGDRKEPKMSYEMILKHRGAPPDNVFLVPKNVLPRKSNQ